MSVAWPIFLALLWLEQSPPAAPADAVDKAFGLSGGSWTCTSFHGEQKIVSFEFSDPNAIVESRAAPDGEDDAAYERRFAFDADKGTWLLSWPSGGWSLTAQPWTHARWTFEGIVKAQRVRVTFTSFGQPAFRRDVETYSAGRWIERNGETCKRLGQ